jgi:hypothetical protein
VPHSGHHPPCYVQVSRMVASTGVNRHRTHQAEWFQSAGLGASARVPCQQGPDKQHRSRNGAALACTAHLASALTPARWVGSAVTNPLQQPGARLNHTKQALPLHSLVPFYTPPLALATGLGNKCWATVQTYMAADLTAYCSGCAPTTSLHASQSMAHLQCTHSLGQQARQRFIDMKHNTAFSKHLHDVWHDSYQAIQDIESMTKQEAWQQVAQRTRCPVLLAVK